jgi:hypothetical protein
MNLLESPVILQTRRNHGLEHATIHVLSAAQPGRALAGRSTPYGFYLYGNVTDEELRAAVENALSRIRNGERHLVVHPGCGTNYLTYGAAASIGALAVLSVGDRRARWSRLPDVMVAATLAMIISHPIGPQLQQRVTTSSDMGDLRIVNVRQLGNNAHYVETQST